MDITKLMIENCRSIEIDYRVLAKRIRQHEGAAIKKDVDAIMAFDLTAKYFEKASEEKMKEREALERKVYNGYTSREIQLELYSPKVCLCDPMKRCTCNDITEELQKAIGL